MSEDMSCMSTRTLRGIILLVLGFILLLHSVGLFQQSLNLLIIIGSIALIAYGAVLAQVPQHIMRLIKGHK